MVDDVMFLTTEDGNDAKAYRIVNELLEKLQEEAHSRLDSRIFEVMVPTNGYSTWNVKLVVKSGKSPRKLKRSPRSRSPRRSLK